MPNTFFNKLDSTRAYGSRVKYTVPMFICLSNPGTNYYSIYVWYKKKNID